MKHTNNFSHAFYLIMMWLYHSKAINLVSLSMIIFYYNIPVCCHIWIKHRACILWQVYTGSPDYYGGNMARKIMRQKDKGLEYMSLNMGSLVNTTVEMLKGHRLHYQNGLPTACLELGFPCWLQEAVHTSKQPFSFFLWKLTLSSNCCYQSW